MKQRIVRHSVQAIRALGLAPVFLNTPRGIVVTKDWVEGHDTIPGTGFTSLLPPADIIELPPVVIDLPVSDRFTRHYRRRSNEGFVAVLPGGRVFGDFANIVITPDNQLLADASREFGAEGGRKPRDFSLFHNRLKMPPLKKLRGSVAVISTCGSNNFHHWNFDVLPRLQLLRMAGLLDNMDKLIIHHNALPFQLEGLKRLGIDKDRILDGAKLDSIHLEAELLYVPSLPEALGTISPWVLEFLRATFLQLPLPQGGSPAKLYVSRRHAPSRNFINKDEVMREILRRGYVEFIPEDHTMEETAAFFAAAKSIVSVHGSGLSNLAFVQSGAKVLDIMAPYHQDPYYWMICNQRKALYVALFSEGDHPPDDLDLVRSKKDDDLLIDLEKLKKALDLVS